MAVTLKKRPERETRDFQGLTLTFARLDAMRIAAILQDAGLGGLMSGRQKVTGPVRAMLHAAAMTVDEAVTEWLGVTEEPASEGAEPTTPAPSAEAAYRLFEALPDLAPWIVTEILLAGYQAEIEIDAEGNASAPSPSGSTAAGAATAPDAPAPASAPDARGA